MRPSCKYKELAGCATHLQHGGDIFLAFFVRRRLNGKSQSSFLLSLSYASTIAEDRNAIGDRRWGQLALSLSRELKDTPARTRQPTITLDYECYLVKSTHDVYENTWKCGELRLYIFPSAGR